MSVQNASQATPWEKTPDVVGEHALSFSGENYALVSRRFKAFHDAAQQRVNFEKIKDYYAVQVLFPEFAAKAEVSPRDFADLNQRVRQLFFLFPSGEVEYRRVETAYAHVDKTLSLDRFETLVNTLAGLVLKAPQSNGVVNKKAAKGSFGLSVVLGGVFAVCLLFHVLPILGFLGLAILALWCVAARISVDYRANRVFREIDSALNGNLRTAQARLSPSFQIQ